MAITSIIETESGVNSQYQKITGITWRTEDGQWRITIELYATEQARRDGKKPLETREVWAHDARLLPSPLRAFYGALTGHRGTAFTGAEGDEAPAAVVFVADGADPADGERVQDGQAAAAQPYSPSEEPPAEQPQEGLPPEPGE